MNNNELKILINLVDKEIDNFKSVYDRTKKENWLTNIDKLEKIKTKLEKHNIEKNEYIKTIDKTIENYFELLEK